MICYHHNDLDGKAAGYCVHKFKPSGLQDTTGSYVSRSYNDKFDKHTASDTVFIVDLSISETTYDSLLDVCKTARQVIWIDHHKSSVDVVAAHKKELQEIKNLVYFISDCACGAALTYAFLNCPLDKINKIWNRSATEHYDIKASYTNGVIDIVLTRFEKNDPANATWHSESIKLPKYLFHVDDYDTWRKAHELTEAFTLGCDTFDTGITVKEKGMYVFNNFWSRIENDMEVENTIYIGQMIQTYLHRRYRSELKNTFEWSHNGTTFLCKNGTGNSWNFEHLIDRYDAVILFYYEGCYGKWKYSVFSRESSKFDCESFAEKFGGGGHLHAAGFTTTRLIFTSNELEYTEKKERTIFLGGTVDDDWREEFMSNWKKLAKDPSMSRIKDIKLFDPVVDNWTPKDRENENRVKANAFINLFVITPKFNGIYSFAEAIECSHMRGAKSVLVIYDKYETGFKYYGSRVDEYMSFDAVGSIIEKNGGEYIKISGPNASEDLVKAIAKLVK